MKKLLSIISIILAGVGLSHAQIGIGTDNPQGALDLNPENGPAQWGLVLPIVPQADTVGVGASDFYPSVTTPASGFRTITTTETTDEGTITIKQLVPEKEAPAGAIVFDETKGGIRVKRTSKNEANDPNGDWCEDKLIDDKELTKRIGIMLHGGEDFKMQDVSAGYYYSIGIKAEDKFVYAVGQNLYYKTGMGYGRYGGSTQTWTVILGNAGPAKQVSAGYQHAAALMENGDVYTWGYNYYGRTGQGVTSGYTMSPAKVNIALDQGDKVIQVQAGYYNSMLLTQQGKVYVTGYAGYGLLANSNGGGTSVNIPQFRQITNFPLDLEHGETIKQISLAARVAAALTSTGRVFTWGRNVNGTTGLGTTSGTTVTPAAIGIPSTDKIIKVEMGIGSGLALTADSLHLYHWGRNLSLGGTASGVPSIQLTPIRIDALTGKILNSSNPEEKIVNIASPKHRNGEYYGDSHLILTNKAVYASGYNTSYGSNPGKLGVINPANGAALSNIVAFEEIQNHAVYENSRFTKASIGYTHAIIMTGKIKEDEEGQQTHAYQDYTSYGAGNNNYYQLGGGATSGWRVFSPVKR